MKPADTVLCMTGSMVTSQMLSSNQSTHEHQLFGAPLGSSSASLTASDSERKSPKTIGSSDDTSPRKLLWHPAFVFFTADVCKTVIVA